MKPSIKSVLAGVNEQLGPELEKLGLKASVAETLEDDIWIKFVGNEKPIFSNVVLKLQRNHQGFHLEQLCTADYEARKVGSRKQRETFFIRNKHNDEFEDLTGISDTKSRWRSVVKGLRRGKIIENAATNRYFMDASEEISLSSFVTGQIGCQRKDGINSWIFEPKKEVRCRLSIEGKDAVLYINEVAIATAAASEPDNIGNMLFRLGEFLENSYYQRESKYEEAHEDIEGFQDFPL